MCIVLMGNLIFPQEIKIILLTHSRLKVIEKANNFKMWSVFCSLEFGNCSKNQVYEAGLVKHELTVDASERLQLFGHIDWNVGSWK